MRNKLKTTIKRLGLLLAALLAALVVVTSSAGAQGSGDSDYASAVQVAQDGFREFLSRAIPEPIKKKYNLTQQDIEKNAELGAPFHLFVIQPEKVNKCAQNICGTVDALGAPIDTYIFPVRFNGQAKLMMTVDRFKGEDRFEIGSLGYASLAREVEILLRSWSRDKGYHPRLFVCDQAHAYAFSIPERGTDNLTLIDFSAEDKGKYAGLSSVNQVVPVLAQRIALSLGKGE